MRLYPAFVNLLAVCYHHLIIILNFKNMSQNNIKINNKLDSNKIQAYLIHWQLHKQFFYLKMGFGSFILGSVFTLFAYQTSLVTYRCLPYIQRSNYLSKFHQASQKQYVIISGATDGIGKAYVQRLLKEGFCVICIGRDQQKLLKLQKQYETILCQNNLKLKTITIDFSKQKQMPQLQLAFKNQTTDEKIIGAINCCGLSHFQRYENLPQSQITSIINTNLNSLHYLLKILQQKQNTKKKFFINVSSQTANFPLKYSSVYSATKAYQSSLLQAIIQELDSHNCQLINLQPWFVRTKMINFRNDWDSAQPSQIVQGSFRLLSWGRSSGAGCAKHELIRCFYFALKSKFNKRTEQQLKVLQKMKAMYERRKKKSN